MNLRKIKNIKNIDLSPISSNSFNQTDRSKVNNILFQKNAYNKYVLNTYVEEDEDRLISNQLNPEKITIFNTEIPIYDKNKHNSIDVSSDHILKREKLFFDTENLCAEMYKKKPNELNDKKVFLYEKLNQGVNFMLKDLRKNQLITKKNNYKHNNLSTSLNFGNFRPNPKKIQQNEKNNYNINDYLQHYYDEFKPKMNNTKLILYENYAQNFKIYKHNQLYNLKKNYFRDKILPPIDRSRSIRVKNFIDLIPERVQDTNESKKKIYSIYKLMKDNKKEFMI